MNKKQLSKNTGQVQKYKYAITSMPDGGILD